MPFFSYSCNMRELSLWEQLKEMGFREKYYIYQYTWWDKFKNWFSREPLKEGTIVRDWLHKEIDGKEIDIQSYCYDFGYVDLSIDGKMIFSQRRFDDGDLLRLIPIETIKITPRQRSFKYNFLH